MGYTLRDQEQDPDNPVWLGWKAYKDTSVTFGPIVRNARSTGNIVGAMWAAYYRGFYDGRLDERCR